MAAESINSYVMAEKMARRAKVDKHHFSLSAKLVEAGLEPDNYDRKSSTGTSEENYAVHNFDDRSKHEIIGYDELFLGHFKHEDRNLRAEDVPNSDQVLGHFHERMTGLAEETAIAESERCMSCGICFECDNCVIFCPQDAVYRVKKDQSTMGRYVATDYSKCIGCQICADVCPTGYIDMGLGG
ncbi:putative glutamate synthase (NADPH) small subunit [bacterium BMS3Bbin11]|nr:putative glutamate synthase (NADPH) small subunit [bacterium BMS3Bbin11]